MEIVSIVVPIYNVEKYLRECLDSIIGQTYSELQIILVDDGSPDGCGAICDEYASRDNRIEVLHCQNGGLSVARNRGFRRCRGKYIYFVDSDDYLEPGAVETLVKTAEENELDILLYDAISFDDAAPQVEDAETVKYIRKQDYSFVQSGADLFLAMLSNDEYRSPVQYYFYRKQFLDRFGLSFHEGIIHEDEEFNFFALMFAERTKHIPQVLYHHRFRRDSIMGCKASRKNTDCLYAVILSAMSRSGTFISSYRSKEAFRVGLARLIGCYFNYMARSADGVTEHEKQQIKQLRKQLSKCRYYKDGRIRRAVLHPYRKKFTIKRLKKALYPAVAPILSRLRSRKNG